MTTQQAAILVLEDGTVFRGFSCGAEGEVLGTVGFNTAMIGYEDVIMHPENEGKILAMTYPQIGNYGINEEEMTARTVAIGALVVHEMCTTPSSYRCDESLPDFLTARNVVAIEGIDTRKLTRHIRQATMRGIVSTEDFDSSSLLAKLNAN